MQFIQYYKGVQFCLMEEYLILILNKFHKPNLVTNFSNKGRVI